MTPQTPQTLQTPSMGVPESLAATLSIAEQHDVLTDHLRRHAVSRRSALKAAAGGAGALALARISFAGSAAAALGSPTARPVAGAAWGHTPELALSGRHLSFGSDPAREMWVGAQLSGKPGRRDRVLLELGHDHRYGELVEAEVRELVSQVPQVDGTIQAADQFYVHALARHLQPGTTYHYRLRLSDGSTTPDATFTTAPSGRGVAAPFTFTAFGDHGVNGPVADGQLGFDDGYYNPADTNRSAAPASSLVGIVAAHRPAFHLLAGDICYADPTGSGLPPKNAAPAQPPTGFNNFDPYVWDTYLASIEASAASTPWMFSTGNHDMEALYSPHGYGGHEQRLDLPPDGPSRCPSVYAFTYGNVGVVSIDANDLSNEIAANAGYSGGTQLRWLTGQLDRFRRSAEVDFIVCFFHHCAFATSATHASDGGVRAALAPLFDRYQVDLAVQGHNHQYERTNPIRAGVSGAQAPDGATIHPAVDGTTYLTAGCGGRPRYAFQPGTTDRNRLVGAGSGTTVPNSFVWGAGAVKQAEAVEWSQARYDDYAVMVVDVVPARRGATTTLTVKAVNDLGVEVDRVTLARRAGAGARAGGWGWSGRR